MDIIFRHSDRRTRTAAFSGGRLELPVAVSGEEGDLEIRFSVPILDVQGYWIPELSAPSGKLDWVVESVCAGQRSFPFMVFLDSDQCSRFAFGSTDLIDDTRITAKMNQERCAYDVAVTVALTPESRNFALILDDRPVGWTAALADWRRDLRLPESAFPAAAWNPVFCTWYAVHAAVTQDWVEQSAIRAAALGFGTLIVDDGWCFDDMKRVTPETTVQWYENIGDWRMSAAKFPDFPAHRRRVRDLGLNYMLWVTPFLIGVKSGFYRKFRDALYPERREGCQVLDCGNAAAAEAMFSMMRRVMTDYELDGLKIDFLDSIPPDVAHPRGRSAAKFIAALSAAVREVRPDALIEFRQHYATPGMLACATQFRAGDVPFDFMENFRRLIQIRISVGDRVPVHADPAYWHPGESAANIARHMIAAMAGVPMLSMDLLFLSETERRIIGFWLGFYRKHLTIFRGGHWEAGYFLTAPTHLTVTANAGTIVFLTDPARLDAVLSGISGPATVLNLSPRELRLPGAATFGPAGEPGADGIIPSGGGGIR